MLLCLFCVCLWAEPYEAHDTYELVIEELPDEFTQRIYAQQAPYQSAANLALVTADKPYLKGQFRLRGEQLQVLGSAKVQDQRLLANLQLRYADHLVLGHYRLNWAEGLILNRTQSARGLLSPPHPETYSPQGIAILINPGAVKLLAFASRQKREAKLIEQQISLLPRSKTDYLGSTMEEVFGAALSYQQQHFSLGALQYLQKYDRSFVDARRDSLLNATSIFAALSTSAHTLQAECAVQDQAALAISWQMKAAGFSQRWRYQRLGNYQRPAYAAKALRLSNTENREELSAQVAYQAHPPLSMQAQSTINKGFGDLDEPKWLGEHKLKLAFADAQSKASITLIGIDREILSAVDSTFISSIPRHYRLYLWLSHKISESISTGASFRYHHQEKELAFKTGSWWEQSLSFKTAQTSFSLAYSIWSSGNYSMLIPDDSDAGYQSLGKNSAALKLSAQQSGRFISGKMFIEQELKQQKSTTAGLSIAIKVK